jgi:hypothetical protein
MMRSRSVAAGVLGGFAVVGCAGARVPRPAPPARTTQAPEQPSSTQRPGTFRVSIDGHVYEGGGMRFTLHEPAGAYGRYWEAKSDISVPAPKFGVDVQLWGGELVAGEYPCASAGSEKQTDVYVRTEAREYWTNVFPSSCSCSIRITDVSRDSITGTASGTIFDETDLSHPAVSFTAAFSATRAP